MRLGRVIAGIGVGMAILLLEGIGPAYAQPPLPNDPNGVDQGIPSGFIVLFVLAIVVGIGVTIWKVSTAQTLAKRSGMDPDLAAQMTLLTDDGLDATLPPASASKRRRPPLLLRLLPLHRLLPRRG
jgi:hypothetical protein